MRYVHPESEARSDKVDSATLSAENDFDRLALAGRPAVKRNDALFPCPVDNLGAAFSEIIRSGGNRSNSTASAEHIIGRCFTHADPSVLRRSSREGRGGGSTGVRRRNFDHTDALHPGPRKLILLARAHERDDFWRGGLLLVARHHARPNRHDSRAFIQTLRLLVCGARAGTRRGAMREHQVEKVFVESLREMRRERSADVVNAETAVTPRLALLERLANADEQSVPAVVRLALA